MAEIRKHKPQVEHAIDKALLAALGEQPKPVVPGAPKPADAAKPGTSPGATTPAAWKSGLPLSTGWTVAKPKAADADDE